MTQKETSPRGQVESPLLDLTDNMKELVKIGIHLTPHPNPCNPHHHHAAPDFKPVFTKSLSLRSKNMHLNIIIWFHAHSNLNSSLQRNSN